MDNINQPKSWFFNKTNKIDTFPLRLIKKREDTNNNRNGREAITAGS